MNWTIEQNYILLKFVRAYGETEWCKHTNELRDMFAVYLTNPLDMEINNFNEDDFRRQYNYILATTRQECLKQGVKLIKSGELIEVALKKFYTYLEQQNKEESGQMDERVLRLLYDNDLSSLGEEQIMAMREKIYRIVGEDLMGMAFGLERLEGEVQRDACINEMAHSWIRRLNDGRVCVAGDTDILPKKLLSELYEAANISDKESDSDATDTLEEMPIPTNRIQVISFQEALDSAELYYLNPTSESRSEEKLDWFQKYGNRKVIAGWELTGKEDTKELNEQLHAWEESLNRSNVAIDFNFESSLQSSTFAHQSIDEQRVVSEHCSTPSSASTQEAFTSRHIFPTPDDMTTGSPSADTALSHTTIDDLDEPSSNKESPIVKRKRRARQNLNICCAKKLTDKSIIKESESKKRIMRNITKMIMDHPYSSIFVKSIREDTGIYRHATLNIGKISHDVIGGDFVSYEHFIEVIILFFLQMKIYYLGDKETVKKIESVYADVSKQLSIIYPDLNDTVPLSDLFQRRQKRFKGNYA